MANDKFKKMKSLGKVSRRRGSDSWQDQYPPNLPKNKGTQKPPREDGKN